MVKNKKNNRLHLRALKQFAEIRGMLTNRNSTNPDKQRPFVIWDVSEEGVGIWSDTEVPLNASVILTIGQPYLLVLNAKVQWCEKQGDSHGFRIGLSFELSQKQIHQSLSRAFKKISKPKDPEAS